jgi:hypothetical protein
MPVLKTKYYNNVYVIQDDSRRKKLQELFLRSLKNDMEKWKKIIRYRDGSNNSKITDTDYYSPNYKTYKFQFDFDLGVGIVSLGNDIYELIFDPEDYKKNKYPEEIRQLFIKLTNTIFTDKVNDIDKMIPKTSQEISEETRNERSQKLHELFGDEV